MGSYSKYRAKPVVIDSRRFASMKESRKYCDLKLLKQAGKIVDFECQIKFPIIINGELICTYIADFVTYDPDGKRHVLDTKSEGTKTAVYRLKKKLMAIVNHITIEEC